MKQTKQCPRCNGTGKIQDPAAVGDAMRAVREKAGLSLRTVATKCGFSAPYLSDLELGRRNWNDDTMEKVGRAIVSLTGKVPKLASSNPPKTIAEARAVLKGKKK